MTGHVLVAADLQSGNARRKRESLSTKRQTDQTVGSLFHNVAPAGHRAQCHAVGHALGVGCDVRLHAVVLLRAAQGKAEAGHTLVVDHERSCAGARGP